MIGAISLALTLISTQPVFCNETLAWEGNPLAVSYAVSVSFEGPDGMLYFVNYETEEARCELLVPYGRKCMVMVAAVYRKDDGDVYTLTSEPFEFEGCASKKRR